MIDYSCFVASSCCLSLFCIYITQFTRRVRVRVRVCVCVCVCVCVFELCSRETVMSVVKGGSNMTGTICV
jgi:hypothetical protein